MPTFRGVSVTLESQYDIMKLPEFPPLEVSSLSISEGASRTLPHKPHTPSFRVSCSPSLSNVSATSIYTTSPIVEVYAPTYPASQFWISYGIAPSAFDKTQVQTRFVYFKLILSGQCVVSWGVGEEEEWKGKTMWGLFREGTGDGWFGKKAVEKRGFFFQGADVEQRLEVQVFRARGRRRVSREFEDRKRAKGIRDVDLVTLGNLDDQSPQRFYQYALLDPVDEPYVTFRYHFRTWKQLEAMGFLQASDTENAEADDSSSSSSYASAEEPPELDHTASGRSDTDADSTLLSAHSVALDPNCIQAALTLMRRLSVPPRIRLVPTTSRMEPSSPIKQDADECPRSVSPISEQDDTENESSVEAQRNWLVRTPSPDKLDHKTLESPPSSVGRTRTGRLLKGVLESAMRRKAGQNPPPREKPPYSTYSAER